MKTVLLSAAVLLGLPVLAAPVAEVTAVRGAASTGSKALALGDKLDRGAEVKTGADGRVRLKFIDGSTLVVSDNSEMRIEAFEMKADQKQRDSASIVLQAGLIGQKVAPSTNGSWEVRTPTAVTAVRGTEFIVEVDDNMATAVNVSSGKVEVDPVPTRSLHQRGGRVSLGTPAAGTMCNLASGCSESSAWSPDRVKRTQERLSID
ncbi:FecR domain-containing protein [Pelomonas sp. KK5]|uniref:FecR family protein n=1 Tax=Pelomonas sp. KK5 TaxID=1855730 RepID=UPI0009F92E4A|nr:FecR domain-containing protein [Pelomonas sp. KK5]